VPPKLKADYPKVEAVYRDREKYGAHVYLLRDVAGNTFREDSPKKRRGRPKKDG
jgi:hypothetical protein